MNIFILKPRFGNSGSYEISGKSQYDATNHIRDPVYSQVQYRKEDENCRPDCKNFVTPEICPEKNKQRCHYRECGMQAGKTVFKTGVTESQYPQDSRRAQLIQERGHTWQHMPSHIYRKKYVKRVSCQIYKRKSHCVLFKNFGILGIQEYQKCEDQKKRKAQQIDDTTKIRQHRSSQTLEITHFVSFQHQHISIII